MALEGDGGRGQEQGGEKIQTMANGMGAFVCFGGIKCSVWLLISSGGCEGSSDSCEEQLEEVKRLYADKEYSKAIQVQRW